MTLAELRAQARAAGVATEYVDWAQRRVTVNEDAVRAVLGALGDLPSRDAPASTVVTRDGTVPGPPDVTVVLDDGGTLPAGMQVPHGYHRLVRADGTTATLISAPPAVQRQVGERLWGWMVQLYGMRSARSWGAGDYRDLGALAEVAAAQGADLVLVNPLHAVAPVLPVERSPYSPASRRLANPTALAIDALPEYAAAGPALRARLAALRPPSRVLVDHDEVWAAKAAALELLAPEDPAVPDDDPVLLQWSVWAALAEVYGGDWRVWPSALRRPGPAAGAAVDPRRVGWHAWVQRRCAEQLAEAQHRARAAGMRIGIVHDLAVGVDPGGADAWALADELVRGATIGAPPDSYNQKGQDWQLPPFHPGRLAESGYAAFRDVVRATLKHAGGLRVDHVMGIWRLWWVPEGRTPDQGTYVHYDADALLAILALEAQRAGALLIGEDLGTVEPAVETRLAAEDLLGCEVLWFATREGDGGVPRPLPPRAWRQRAAASISTHDLPTAYGWLADEPARVRSELGLLAVPYEQEQERMRIERQAWLALLLSEGLLDVGAEGDPDAVVLALHRLLARTPSCVVLAAHLDATGDLRQPNLPGTVPGRDPYPSWCLPVGDRHGRPLGLETLRQHPGVARVAHLLSDGVRRQEPRAGAG